MKNEKIDDMKKYIFNTSIYIYILHLDLRFRLIQNFLTNLNKRHITRWIILINLKLLNIHIYLLGTCIYLLYYTYLIKIKICKI